MLVALSQKSPKERTQLCIMCKCQTFKTLRKRQLVALWKLGSKFGYGKSIVTLTHTSWQHKNMWLSSYRWQYTQKLTMDWQIFHIFLLISFFLNLWLPIGSFYWNFSHHIIIFFTHHSKMVATWRAAIIQGNTVCLYIRDKLNFYKSYMSVCRPFFP